MDIAMKRLILLVLALFLVGGCAGRTRVESDLGVKGAPDWVNEGTQILKDKNGRLFHGVGQAPAMGDDSLQISTADNRARAEVARVLSTFMDVVNSDYGSAAAAGDKMLSQQSISRKIDSMTRTNLSGTKIIGHWRNRKNGTVYAVAELDLERVTRIVAASQEMNQGFGKFLSAEADNIFDRQIKEMK